MKIQRCPECGIRLNNSYCDICMKRVPFKGVPVKQTFQHVEGSSAHRMEKHPCISFEEEQTSRLPRTKTTFTSRSTWQDAEGSSAHRTEDHTCLSFEETEKKAAPKAQRPKVTFSKANTGFKGLRKGAVIAIILTVVSLVSAVGEWIEETSFGSGVEEVLPQEVFMEDVEGIPAIAPTQIYSDGQITVTADGAGLNYDDYAVSFTVTNDSDNKISVGTNLLSVNGFMLTCGMYEEIKAGESRQVLLPLYSYELEKCGIDTVGEIAFCLDIMNLDDYSGIASTDVITLQTDAAGTFGEAIMPSGTELYNDGSLLILLNDVEWTGYGDCNLHVYMENRSGSTVSVETTGIRLNGETAQGLLWNTLRSGTKVIDTAYLYELEELGIEELEQITEISLDLQINYMDGWDTVDTVTHSVSFGPVGEIV